MAESLMTVTKKNTTRVLMRLRGYNSRYAPITPPIAPLAPTSGVWDAASMNQWDKVAATPVTR